VLFTILYSNGQKAEVFMKFLFSKICLVFLFCFTWQNSNSQLLYPEGKKGEYLPPYEPSDAIIKPEVEKWMKEEFAKTGEKKTVKMKTDGMGRVKSSSDGTEQVKIADGKQKRLVMVSDMHIREQKIEPESGRYEYSSKTKKYDYYLNNKKISDKEFFEYQNKSFEKFKKQKRGKRDLPVSGVIGSDDRTWVAWMTADEISALAKSYKELVIMDYEEPTPASSQDAILSTTQLSSHAFSNNYKGNGIGVYVVEPACAILSGITDPDKYTADNDKPCSKGFSYSDSAHHTMVANVVHMAAPQAHIFGFTGSNFRPSNPDSYSPPLEIGSHSYHIGSQSNYFYSGHDANMDNYIYENKVTNFICAGNKENADDNFYVTSPGKAVNAITVGAVNLGTVGYGNYVSYSRWRNPILENKNGGYNITSSDKPEMAMFTGIDLVGYGTFTGTSASTPLAAGFAATLLDQHPFFKRQPALMKAVLLTGETIPIPNAYDWDTDNNNVGVNASVSAKKIVTYSSVAWGTRSAWWHGGNSDFFDSNSEIRFTENDIQANKRYRIAISWLVSGTYVHDNAKMPQDLDLIIEQNGKTIAYSESAKNTFEIVDFTTASNAPLTVIIRRFSNSGSGNLFLGYHLRENF
jgi:hypothetical protein